MDNVISFTPAQLIGFITAICGGIVSIAAAVSVLIKVYNKSKAPERAQNMRIEKIEGRLEDHEKILKDFRGYFSNDDQRLRAIENGNRITQTALLALLKHALNGNDIETLKTAEKNLEEFLINK